MSVAELYNRVVNLESRLGLHNEEKNYSERLLALLEALDVLEEEAVAEAPELDAGALEDHLSRLQSIVGQQELDTSVKPEGSMEKIMARIESQLHAADLAKD